MSLCNGPLQLKAAGEIYDARVKLFGFSGGIAEVEKQLGLRSNGADMTSIFKKFAYLRRLLY